MWNLSLVGLAVVVLAIVAVEAFRAWEEWFTVALGAWLLVSPWVLGFSVSRVLMWTAVIFGALVLFFAGWTLVVGGGLTRSGLSGSPTTGQRRPPTNATRVRDP